MASKAKGIHRLLKKFPSSIELNRVFSEIQLLSDYPAVMISSSLMDAGLRHLLSGYLIADIPTNLFEGNMPIIGTFSSKITLAYAMGLIGPKTKDVLNVIRDIRNLFAHYTLTASFEIEEIKIECEKIKTPRIYTESPPEIQATMQILTPRNPPKLNYVHLCSFICMEIHNHLVLKDNPQFLVQRPIEIY